MLAQYFVLWLILCTVALFFVMGVIFFITNIVEDWRNLLAKLRGKREEVNLETLFYVIDKKTGKEPDLEQIVLTEDWAKDLVYYDIAGFLLSEYGSLILADEYGNWAYCPPQTRYWYGEETALCVIKYFENFLFGIQKIRAIPPR